MEFVRFFARLATKGKFRKMTEAVVSYMRTLWKVV